MRIKKIALILSLVIGITGLFPKITYGVSNGWINSQGVWYFYENGNKNTGWIKDNGHWYYLNSDGVMVTGWQYINSTWYYLNNDGSMKTGWLKQKDTWVYLSDKDEWYYLNDNGSMAIGWKNINDKWYYLNPDGCMSTGWVRDGDEYYYLKSDGSMACNMDIDDMFCVDENGHRQLGTIKNYNMGKRYRENLECLNKFNVASSSVILGKQDKSKNSLYSPISIFRALSVLSEGAQNSTRDSIRKGLNVSETSDLAEFCNEVRENQGSKLSEQGKYNVADSIWINNKNENIKFNDESIKEISNAYESDIFKEDLTSNDTAKKISEWVSKNTYGLLGNDPNEFKQNDKNVAIEIFNTIYLKDNWSFPFSSDNTKKDKFHLNDGKSVEVDFMNKNEYSSYLYEKENEYTIAELGIGSRLQMSFILPAEGKSPYDILNDKDKLEEALKYASHLYNYCNAYSVNFKVPKFKYTCSMDLNDSMKELGFGEIYSQNADFSRFGTSPQGLYVSNVKQNTGITVDENGTEAAAFTELDMKTGSVAVDCYEERNFILDRPFIFTIMDNTGAPIFIGVVNNPLK